MSDTKLLAQQIAKRLFTNGAAQEADRLVLELPGKHDGGGWCRKAVEDQILEAIAAWNTRPAAALTPKQAAADEMYAALTSVAANLDPDSTDSDQYRNDDPEGAMDTCFSIARAALAKAGQQ